MLEKKIKEEAKRKKKKKKKKLFQTKFCVGLRSIGVTFFYCGLLDVFVFSKM